MWNGFEPVKQREAFHAKHLRVTQNSHPLHQGWLWSHAALKDLPRVECQQKPFYSVLHTKSISPLTCFVFCFFRAMDKSQGQLLDLNSSYNPSNHNFQPVENIHSDPNTQETSNHSAQPLLHCCPDISSNGMSWENPAKHYLKVHTHPDTLQFVHNAICKYDGTPAATSPSALGLTRQTIPSFLVDLLISILHSTPSENTGPQHDPHLIHFVYDFLGDGQEKK